MKYTPGQRMDKMMKNFERLEDIEEAIRACYESSSRAVDAWETGVDNTTVVTGDFGYIAYWVRDFPSGLQGRCRIYGDMDGERFSNFHIYGLGNAWDFALEGNGILTVYDVRTGAKLREVSSSEAAAIAACNAAGYNIYNPFGLMDR